MRNALVVVGIGACVVLLGAYLLSSRDGDRFSAEIERCSAEGPRKQQCFDEFILAEAKSNGISAGLDALGAVYARDKKFASYCHGNTHELGIMAYDLFTRNEDISLSDKSSYCGFGFFHGFLEGLFANTGDLDEARRFCEYIDTNLKDSLLGVSFACYHGIGHGVVDGSDPERWGNDERFIEKGLALCDTLGEIEEHKERCASGVFNALAIAYLDPKYKLTVDPQDPFLICRKQGLRYAREACYDQMNSYIVKTTDSFSDALRLAARAEETYKGVTVASVAAFRARDALAGEKPLHEFVEECNVLPSPLHDKCAEGFGAGLMEFGKPGEEYTAALHACENSGERTHACFRGVADGVRYRLRPDVHDAFCSDVATSLGQLYEKECTERMAGTYIGT